MNTTILRMASRNVLRNRRRSALTVSAIGLAVAFVWLCTGLTQGMMIRAVARATEGVVGHVQIHAAAWDGEPTPDTLLDPAAVAALEGHDPTLAVAPRAFGRAFASRDARAVGVMLFGIDPAREAAASELDKKLVAGRYLDDPDGVLLGVRLAQYLEVSPGDAIDLRVFEAGGAFGDLRPRVAGVVSTGIAELDESALFIPLPRLLDATSLSGLHEIMVRGDDAADAAALATRLQAADLVDQVRIEDWRTLAPEAAVMLDVANYTFAGFALVIVLAVATATLLTQSMVVFERRRELAVLRAIGVRPLQLVRLLVYESMLLGLVGAGLGVALSAPLLLFLSREGIDMSSGTELEFSGLLLDPIVFPTIDWSVAIEAVLTAVVLAGGASLLAGVRSAWRPPLGVIREN